MHTFWPAFNEQASKLIPEAFFLSTMLPKMVLSVISWWDFFRIHHASHLDRIFFGFTIEVVFPEHFASMLNDMWWVCIQNVKHTWRVVRIWITSACSLFSTDMRRFFGRISSKNWIGTDIEFSGTNLLINWVFKHIRLCIISLNCVFSIVECIWNS